jgi:hypothetical protein
MAGMSRNLSSLCIFAAIALPRVDPTAVQPHETRAGTVDRDRPTYTMVAHPQACGPGVLAPAFSWSRPWLEGTEGWISKRGAGRFLAAESRFLTTITA